MKIILEISEKERNAMKKAGENIKKSLNKLKNSFQVRVVKNKNRK